MSQPLNVGHSIRALSFREERSRPVWRNRHTDREVVVKDIAVDDNGGFQGGCRRFVVITNEDGPPGYPFGPRAYELERWLEHWEPTGAHVAVADIDAWGQHHGGSDA
jgi:hypothetical protein